MLPIVIKAEQQGLEEQLRKVIANKKAQIGIAVIINGKDTITINNDERYPMMSMFKLHQALVVADYCEKKGLSFDTPIYIRKADLKTDTYSPLRDLYPDGDISQSKPPKTRCTKIKTNSTRIGVPRLKRQKWLNYYWPRGSSMNNTKDLSKQPWSPVKREKTGYLFPWKVQKQLSVIKPEPVTETIKTKSSGSMMSASCIYPIDRDTLLPFL